MCIFSHHSEWSLIVMVNFMNVLVDPFVMEELMNKEMPGVFDHKTSKNFTQQHIPAENESTYKPSFR